MGISADVQTIPLPFRPLAVVYSGDAFPATTAPREDGGSDTAARHVLFVCGDAGGLLALVWSSTTEQVRSSAGLGGVGTVAARR